MPSFNAAIVVNTMTVSGNGIANTVTLNAPSGTVAYTPARIEGAYAISTLALDGTGQTIAIVDEYDNPNIFQSIDAFDSQFGLTSSGATLYQQYGPASSFLTVLNQDGQATSLPATDPNGAGTDNWEIEEALDVEWVHAIAPGAPDCPGRSQQPVALGPDGRRGDRRQPARRVSGVDELGLRRGPGCLRRR